MTDQTNHSGDDAPHQASPSPVTIEEFNSVDFESGLPDSSKVEPHDLQSQYAKLARDAEANKNHTAAKVFGLLSRVCGIHLKPEDRAEPWGPMAVFDGRRSEIPSDFRGEQNASFLAIIDKIKNPGLRARLADIAWSNDRKTAGRAAVIAAIAYQECAKGLLEGVYKPYIDKDPASFETLGNVQRAFSITQSTAKKDTKGRVQFNDALKSTALNLYTTAKDTRKYVVFRRIAELLLRNDLIAPTDVARDCEALAATKDLQFTMPIKSLWDLAARLHSSVNNKDAEQKCRFEAVQQTLAMREQVTSAAAKAHWVNQALLQLRHIDGREELEDTLVLELRRLQRASTKELTTFSFPLKVEGLRERAEELFSNLNFSVAMQQFGLLTKSTSIETLKQDARDNLKSSPLFSMVTTSHIDNEGKLVAISDGSGLNDEHSDSWYRRNALQNESFRRQRIVAGAIEPARAIIHERFAVEERHIEPIIEKSPFVPQSQAVIITLGVTRFFQGDFISAAHLLFSQLEPCLRGILKINGHDPVRRFDDGTEEDYDINAMMTRMRPELNAIFGEDLVYEIDLLFVGRPGPSLRNSLSHGHISSDACFHPDVIYGCWFIYRLCMAFLLPYWANLTPELDATN
jgi:hypothetical protein